MKRESAVARDRDEYDIAVIGGGINGCSIARDAAGRGYSVFLAEMNDLASGTSSGSTKLIHGGLRYLEHYEFRLVREALIEREVLWANAPHVVRPLRFVLPHHGGLRPAWLLRLGLFLYDHMGCRDRLPPTRTLDMRRDAAGQPLKPLFRRAFEYSDCRVDDARLVLLNARDAADRGARIRTRTRVTDVRRGAGRWRVAVHDFATGEDQVITARLVVNAAGPWIDRVLVGAARQRSARNVRLVQGSHIVVPRLFRHDRAYIFQNADGRIVFAIPYEGDFTLIGTTDRDFSGDPETAAISPEETRYLCEAASAYLARPITPADVVWTFSAVRSLLDDGAGKPQEATRDYVLREQGSREAGVMVNVFGGKITTCRRLAETVLERIEDALGARGGRWTDSAPLPGGDFPADGFDAEVASLKCRYRFIDHDLALRLTRLYGTHARSMLGHAETFRDLGRCFGADLFEAEVRYLMDREWASSAEDVLWRRTKLGLRLTPDQARELEGFIAARLGRRAQAAD